MKKKIGLLIVGMAMLLSACDVGKDDLIKDIKYDLSTEYNVPVTDVEVEVIDYGVTIATTNQFKATIKSKDMSFYLIDKNNSNNFRRVPIEK